MTLYCCACQGPRKLTELLKVTDTRSGLVRFVCRPSVDGRCFTDTVRDRTQDRIEAAA